MPHLVVLTGAGVSAESGIQTFRDSNGLWENHRIEDVASPEGFTRDMALVLDFYNQRRAQARLVEPNAAHVALADFARVNQRHWKVTIITQNVDDLHERAGSYNVVHLHGELNKMRSVVNRFVYDCPGDIHVGDLDPHGSQLRPHIVWFGEAVPAISEAQLLMDTADVLLVVGTSLQVYPAAGLLDYTRPDCPIYLVDPNTPAVYGANTSEIHLIPEVASVGVPLALAKILHS